MDTVDVISKLGVPVAFSALLMYSFYKACSWFANWLRPKIDSLLDAHLKFLEAVKTATVENSTSLKDAARQRILDQEGLIVAVAKIQDAFGIVMDKLRADTKLDNSVTVTAVNNVAKEVAKNADEVKSGLGTLRGLAEDTLAVIKKDLACNEGMHRDLAGAIASDKDRRHAAKETGDDPENIITPIPPSPRPKPA